MDKDTNLNYSYFTQLKKEVCDVLHSSCKLNSSSRKMSSLSKKINYVKLFSKQGVQGIVGLLELKKNKTPFVFKVSVELDKSVEHENSVLESLNIIKPFCPHFVSSYTMRELPVSRAFILENKEEDSEYDEENGEDEEEEDGEEEEEEDGEDSDETDKIDKKVLIEQVVENKKDETDDDETDDLNLFTFDDEYSLNNVLFLEYISNMSLKHVIKYSDKQILYSQILCVLCGLYMAQKHLHFTHYDLHIDNVMMKKVEDNSIFVYNLGSDSFIVPTFGIYPVIIDMGSSYCKNLEGVNMKSSTSHYHVGLQPTFYDAFNDIHHFLLSLFNEIEKDTDEYYFLSTRLMWFFKSVPVLRKKGWKTLPNNILRNVKNNIKDVCPELYELTSYKDMDRDFIEVLSFGIELPWTDKMDNDINTDIEEGLKKYFVLFFKEFQKFDEIDDFEDQYDLLYLLKEIVDIIYKNKDRITKNMDKHFINKLKNDFKSRVECCLIDFSNDIDFGLLFYNGKLSISLLNVMYFKEVIPNIEKINDSYKNMEVKSIIDFIKLFKRNTSVRYVYNRHSVLYLWDSVGKKSKRLMLNSLISNAEIEKLNNDHPTLSEYKILKLLKLKK